MQPMPVIAFSHLPWDENLKRPHHVMSRIAARRPVLFVEEPVQGKGEPSLEITSLSRNLRIARPRLPELEPGAGFSLETQNVLTRLLRAQLARDTWEDHAAWLYTPMAVSAAKRLRPSAIVYECIADLSAFPVEPEEVDHRERELLMSTDVVMTNGPALYYAHCDKHSFVRCFPSSVDASHFERRRWMDDAYDQEELPHPRLGYFGGIDERLDVEVLDALATSHPDWQIVLIGPLLRIDPAVLPRRPNLHVLGARGYAELPAYASGWDLGIIPFAVDSATRVQNPAQTLEYAAADLPVVSTPIPDVVELYGDFVYQGEGAAGFVKACEAALAAPTSERNRRRGLARGHVRKNSWDETAHQMEDILRYVADAQRVRETPQWIPAYQGIRL